MEHRFHEVLNFCSKCCKDLDSERIFVRNNEIFGTCCVTRCWDCFYLFDKNDIFECGDCSIDLCHKCREVCECDKNICSLCVCIQCLQKVLDEIFIPDLANIVMDWF